LTHPALERRTLRLNQEDFRLALLIGPEFDEFLYAPIGANRNGTGLSVLSALAPRRLLIHGARATVARVRSGQMKSAWLSGLLSRRHFNVATVALANKTARVAWAVMSTEQAYRRAA
jgi:hypothetical protein